MTDLKYEDIFSDDEEYNDNESLPTTTTNLQIETKLSISKNLIDPEWEIIDPVPDIYKLFQIFDCRFFQSSLGSVEVKWSKRMTVCAGVCRYQGRCGLCSISLSENLLKFRPRKDLVETLLHEMIHAYLFVTNNFRDRDDHGPKFQSHMNRINSQAGTKITIYHSFHDEVNFYKVHWWRCDGPCQKNPPFYGWVKRSMNRAPGPNDFWWKNHKAICDGNFIKIKEPEKKQKSSAVKRVFSTSSDTPKSQTPKSNRKQKGLRNITEFMNKSVSSGSKLPTSSEKARDGLQDITELMNKSVSSSSELPTNSEKAREFIPFSGQGVRLGGESSADKSVINKVPCPVCAKIMDESIINSHLDNCLMQQNNS